MQNAKHQSHQTSSVSYFGSTFATVRSSPTEKKRVSDSVTGPRFCDTLTPSPVLLPPGLGVSKFRPGKMILIFNLVIKIFRVWLSRPLIINQTQGRLWPHLDYHDQWQCHFWDSTHLDFSFVLPWFSCSPSQFVTSSRNDINLDMLIWLSESRLSDLFSEVSLIRDNQGREFKGNSLIIKGLDNQVMKSLIIKVFTTSLPSFPVLPTIHRPIS